MGVADGDQLPVKAEQTRTVKGIRGQQRAPGSQAWRKHSTFHPPKPDVYSSQPKAYKQNLQGF